MSEHHEVQRVVDDWLDAIKNHDVERVLSLCSGDLDGKAVRGAFEAEFADTNNPVTHNGSDAIVTVDGERATVEPVHVTDLRKTELVRLILGKEPIEWRIAGVEHIGLRPIEWGMPGLGVDHVRRLDSMVGETLSYVHQTIIDSPSEVIAAPERHHALRALDQVFHTRSAPFLHSVRDYLRERIDVALGQIATEEVVSGITVWQLYSHGWIVKTRTHHWAHDICEGYGGAVMTEAQIDGLLDGVDALFCSHWHRDHTSPVVLKRAMRLGVPVLTSPIQDGRAGAVLNALGTEVDEVLPHITIVEPGSTGEVAGLRYHALPGHQDDLFNTMFVVEADGETVMQTGDEWNVDDFPWIAKLSESYKIDLLLSWMVELKLYTDGIRPRVVIPGHENELGHLIEHREPYDQAFEKLREVDCDWHVLAWGERAHVPPASASRQPNLSSRSCPT
jgi:glyoxylase-like metal-dependent hydrolase (beta-lactamase superfamily II)